jgi:energy-coupling factor transporter ATP-binding protein EcfA2
VSRGLALELQRVAYRYPAAQRPALDGIDLAVRRGELVVIAGGSGSGKSTLLRTVCGLVPHFYGGTFAGRALIGGRDLREHGPATLAEIVGTLFQDPETQVVMGTVSAELAFPLENRGWGRAQIARAVQETALALGIDRLLDRATSELSGGELQRVALAATLAGGPQLIVLDEPTSQLDPVAGDELISLLRRLNDDLDVTILLAEHRLERCLPIADRVIALHDGRIVCDAPPDRFLDWACTDAPALATPGARLLQQLGLAPKAAVKRARAALRHAGFEAVLAGATDDAHRAQRERQGQAKGGGWRRRRRAAAATEAEEPALELERVWYELPSGPVALRGVSLRLAPGERIALMGRNGAGKSTLLHVAAGLAAPTRGRARRAGRIALLLQNPNSYLVHERVRDEASADALEAVGLGGDRFAARHPRELSGGERQRLALAVVLDAGGEPPAAVLLDEPTRGIDRDARARLLELLDGLRCAVIVATHDAELAAALTQRVVLLGDGAIVADGTTAEILAGGSYFATETARILGGAGGALTPEQGVRVLAGADTGGLTSGVGAR